MVQVLLHTIANLVSFADGLCSAPRVYLVESCFELPFRGSCIFLFCSKRFDLFCSKRSFHLTKPTFCKQQATTALRLTTSFLQSLSMINLPSHSVETDSDDSSTSSTIAINSLLKAEYPLHYQQSASNNKKKTVRFNENGNERYNNTQLCKEDCKASWYTAHEYSHWKSSTKFLAGEIARNEKRLKSVNCYKRVLERTYEASSGSSSCSILTTQENEKQLEQWMRVTTCRLGLERLAIRSIAIDRYQRRADIVDTVLELQEEMNRNSSNITTQSSAEAEILRQASEEISQTSRLFARHLAVALQNSSASSS